MNGAPDVMLWVELLLALGGGTALVVGTAALLERLVKTASGRRLLWRAATVCLAALVLGEITGSAPLLARLLRVPQAPLSVAPPSEVSELGLVTSSTPAPGRIPELITPSTPAPAGAIPDGTAGKRSDLAAAEARPEERASPSFGPTSAAPPAPLPPAPIESTVPPPRDEPAKPPQASIVMKSDDARTGDTDGEESSSGLWWPGIVWIAGAVPLLARALFGWTALFFLCRRPAETSTSELAARADSLARRLGLEGRVRVLRASGLSGPLAAGIVRSAVVIPKDFERDYDAAQQDAMLLHELAHLRGHDPAWHVVSDLVTTALWWHPLAWWARHELRVASEFAADEASVLVDGGPDALAASLVKVGSRLMRPGFSGLARVEGSGFRSGLGRRVERLLRLADGAPDPSGTRLPRVAKAAVTAALVAAVVCSSLWLRPRTVEADLDIYRENTLQGERAMTSTLFPLWKRSLAGLTFLAVAGAGAGDAGGEDTALQEPDATPVVDLSDDPPPADEDDLDEARGAKDPLLPQELNEARQAQYERAVRLAVRKKYLEELRKQVDVLQELAQAHQASQEALRPGARESETARNRARERQAELGVRLNEQIARLRELLQQVNAVENEGRQKRASRSAGDRESHQLNADETLREVMKALQQRTFANLLDTQAPPPPAKPAPAIAPPPPAPPAPTPLQQPAPQPDGFSFALPSRASDTSSHGDLIGLATKLADAMGDARLARLRYNRVRAMADQNVISQDEMDAARINLETAEQKIQLLREIARAYVRQAESHLIFLHGERDRLRRHATPDESALRSIESQMQAAEAMLSVLSSLASLKEPGAADEAKAKNGGTRN